MSDDRNALIVSVLPDYRRWLGAVSRDMCGLHNREHQDDLMQEGYIAMWRATATYDPSKGALPSYLTFAALLRMRDVARRGFRNWTGHEGKRGGHGPLLVTVLQPLSDDFDAEDVSLAQAMDSALWGYHRGQLLDALSALSGREREYIWRRFWGHATVVELDAYFGTRSTTTIWVPAKAKLFAALAHLVSA